MRLASALLIVASRQLPAPSRNVPISAGGLTGGLKSSKRLPVLTDSSLILISKVWSGLEESATRFDQLRGRAFADQCRAARHRAGEAGDAPLTSR
jgi:hypothetical protein